MIVYRTYKNWYCHGIYFPTNPFNIHETVYYKTSREDGFAEWTPIHKFRYFLHSERVQTFHHLVSKRNHNKNIMGIIDNDII